MKQLVRVHPAQTQMSMVRKRATEPTLDSMLDEMTDDQELSVTIISSQMYLGDIQERMRCLKNTCNQNSESKVPILDVSNLTERDLFFLVSIFVQKSEKDGLESVSNSRKDLQRQLSKYIPYCKLQEPPITKPAKEQKNCTSCFFVLSTHTCSACGNRFCQPCLHTKIVLPRLGLNSPQPVCTACLATSQHKDMEDWMEAGKNLLKEDTKAAIGCFLMATSACEDEVPPTLQLARFLVDNGYPEMAIPFMASVILYCNDPKQLLKVYLIVATAFRRIAENASIEVTEQWKLLLAAKEASSLARSEGRAMADTTLEMLDQLSKRTDEINEALHAAVAVKDKKFAQQMNGYLALLDLAWQQRDWDNLLKVVLNDSLLNGDILVKEDGVIEALEQFVSGKEKYIEQMLPDDRFPIMFLRGLVKLHHQSISPGVSDIEVAAWSGFHSNWLCEAAVKIVLKLLMKGEGNVLPLEEVRAACNTLQRQILEKSLGNEKTCPVFFRTLEELAPPSTSKQQWPNISVTGHNVKIFRKYEQAISKNIASGDLSEHEAALAYLDLFKTCEHPSEAAMCFLTAGLWFLKELSVTSSKLDKYTIKKAIMCCMETAHQIAVFSLHPGMQMYISRLSIAVALCTIQLSGDFATEEDGKILIQLLHTFVYSCRFCPFWNAPIVNLSEVYLMNLLSGRLHTEFTLGLTDIDEQQRPVDTSELKYQLYENDLRHFHSLDDPDDAHVEAMNEFLKTKGWSMDDVTNLLYSPLTPYDAEGWLMQQPVLGVPQEFAELRGLVIDMDENRPSIELLVEKSNRRNVGLFSMSDIHTALDLKKDELMPMFFSLDPPKGSRNQRFHPFQEFRYFSENFTDTDLLHTMFHTDYLLKSFSVGTEVSCKPPFNQRPCTEGLLAKLPYSLQQVLRPVAERGHSHNRVHRFCIQADEIVLDESEQTGPKKLVRIGHVKMAIRSHLLLPDREGKMQDAPEDDDPDSPEAKFAADLTEHYDEICKYFPMLARLRELCKVQRIGIIVNSELERLERKANDYDLVIPNDIVVDALGSMYLSMPRNAMKQARKMLASFTNELHSLTAYGKKSPRQNPCKWVPAALLKQKRPDGNTFSLCYGGVCLNPKVRHNRVLDSQTTTTTRIPQRSSSRPQVFTYNQTASARASGAQQSSGRPQASDPPLRQHPTRGAAPAGRNGGGKGGSSGGGGGKSGGGGGGKSGGSGSGKNGGGGSNGGGGNDKIRYLLWLVVATYVVMYIATNNKPKPPRDPTTTEDKSKATSAQPKGSDKPPTRKERVSEKIQPYEGASKQNLNSRDEAIWIQHANNDITPNGKSNFVIYRIKFSDGQFYIGRTTQALEARMTQHDRDIEKGTKTLGKHAASMRAAGKTADYEIEILCAAKTKEGLIALEQMYINHFGAVGKGLNVYK